MITIKLTPNYGFKKPDESDKIDINDLNSNMDILDLKLKQEFTDYKDFKGDLSTLKTNAKDNIPNIINELSTNISELFTNVSDGKSLVATAITDKGVNTSGSDTFQKIATNIRLIETDPSIGTTDSVAGNILLGKKAISQGKLLIGTMPNYTAVTGTATKASAVNCYKAPIWNDVTTLITVPPGYYEGSHSIGVTIPNLTPANVKSGVLISANPASNSGLVGTFTGVGTATPAHVLAGATFSNNTQMGVAGTIPVRTNTDTSGSYPVATNTSHVAQVMHLMPPRGYYDGSTWLKTTDPNFIAANIKNGVVIGTGTGSKMTGTFKGVGTATQANVLAGTTFSNNTQMGVAGTMVNRGTLNQNITTNNGQISLATGYYVGGTIKAIFSNLIASNIRSGVNIGGVVGTYAGAISKMDWVFYRELHLKGRETHTLPPQDCRILGIYYQTIKSPFPDNVNAWSLYDRLTGQVFHYYAPGHFSVSFSVSGTKITATLKNGTPNNHDWAINVLTIS